MKNQKVKTKNFILFLLFAICYLLFADSALAQYKLETGLPPIAGQPSPSEGLPQYINYLFIFGLGAIAILALAQMMIGGLTYILAAGNVAKVEDAKETIQQALLGLGLLLVSYLLLRTINPDLVNLRNPNLAPTQFQGETCVEWNAEGLQACMDAGGLSWEECQKAACVRFQGEAPGPTGPNEPPQPGRPSVFIYNVASPEACTGMGGQIFSPCQEYCLATPGLCGANNICCGTKP